MKRAVFASVLVLCFTGFNIVESVQPQPLKPDIKTETLDEHSHLEGELPPKYFPNDQALAKLITKVTNTSDLNKNNNTDHDNTSVDKKSAKVPSEIPDLLNTDYFNVTYEDKNEKPINNDTETVNGPHVINGNKTHEEDASSILSNSTVTEENNATLKNEHLANKASTENESDKTNYSNNRNDSSTTMPLEVTTELGIKQNSTENEMETTTNLSHEELKNVTDILESQSTGNESTTEESVTYVPTVENTTFMNVNTSNNATVELESEAKNCTVESTTSVTKETSKHVTVTDKPSDRLETTSVNISENIINYKEGVPAALAVSHDDEHSQGSSAKSSPFLQPTESAAILAAVFVAIALLGYVGLLVWRRILEKRYGNREVLVNEDDFYDTNDLRNFEL